MVAAKSVLETSSFVHLLIDKSSDETNGREAFLWMSLLLR